MKKLLLVVMLQLYSEPIPKLELTKEIPLIVFDFDEEWDIATITVFLQQAVKSFENKNSQNNKS